jgi:hypothetical protein
MNLKILYFVIALILLLVVVYNTYLWINVSSDETKPYEQVLKEYIALFPSFITSGRQVTVIRIIVCGLSMFFFFKSSSEIRLKKISSILLLITCVLCFWSIFSLM